ncbi:serine hydrolase domain-containing protein [Paenibacillus sp. CAU 1782]
METVLRVFIGTANGTEAIAASGLYGANIVDEQRLDSIAEKGMKDLRIPGLAVGIVMEGEVVFLKGYGQADEEGRPVTPQTPFIIGSISKSFTALAILQLEEQGKLELDNGVQFYLPWFKLHEKDRSRPVSIRDLLRQSSGISTYDGRALLVAGAGSSPAEALRAYGGMKHSGYADGKFHYSNANYILLGAIIEQVTGDSYSNYIEQSIFGPLQMNNSYADPDDAEENGLASGYQSIFGKLAAVRHPIRAANVPAGYLAASAEDMTHYILAQMSGGRFREAQLLSQDKMQSMHAVEGGYPYGLGWFVNSYAISHGGDAENYHGDVFMRPDQVSGIVVLMNTNNVLNTKVYGGKYEELAFQLFLAATGGKNPVGVALSATDGHIEEFMNIVSAVLVLWCLLSILCLFRKRRIFAGKRAFLQLFALVVFMFYMAGPLIFLFWFPSLVSAPWPLILLFMPGWGHVLFITPVMLAIIGLIEEFILVLGVIRRARWRSVS